MSTQINVTIDSGGLTDKARQLQTAARQAQLEKERQQRIEAQGTEQRTAAQASQGRAPDGTPLYSPGFKQPQIERRPAANRSKIEPQEVYQHYDGLLVISDDDSYNLIESFSNFDSSIGPIENRTYDYAPGIYKAKLYALNGNEYNLPLFNMQDLGVTFYDYKEINAPDDITGTWPTGFPNAGNVGQVVNPEYTARTASCTIKESFSTSSRDYNPTSIIMPLSETAYIRVVAGKWRRNNAKKDVEINYTVWLQFDRTETDSNGTYDYFWLNQQSEVVKNTSSQEVYTGSFCESFLISQDNVKRINTPVNVATWIKDIIRQDTYTPNTPQTRNSFGNGLSTRKIINGVITENDATFIGSVNFNFVTGATPRSEGFGSTYFTQWGTSGNFANNTNVDKILGTSCHTPAIYTYLNLDVSSLPPTTDTAFWQDAEAVRLAYLSNVETPEYGVRSERTPETSSLPYGQGKITFDTVFPPVNTRSATVKVIAKGKVEYNDNDSGFYFWDWGKPEYCRQQALALGFTEADLTP